MRTVWWVRHAPTGSGVMTPPDAPADLSDRAALATLAQGLPDAPVVSSALLRARMTADALAGGRPRLPDDPALNEADLGVWTGLHWTAIAAGWPDLSRAYWEAPGDAAPPGGDSWNALAARVGAAADRLAAAHDTVIAVSHQAAILTQIARALGEAPAAALSRPVRPLSVTVLACARPGAPWQALRLPDS